MQIQKISAGEYSFFYIFALNAFDFKESHSTQGHFYLAYAKKVNSDPRYRNVCYVSASVALPDP
jgi:hypothetical protein